MALSGSRLRTAIVNALQSVDPSMTSGQVTQLSNAWLAVANAIIAEITGNAVVNPGTFQNTAAIPVQVSPPLYTGATTAAEPITGAGTVS